MRGAAALARRLKVSAVIIGMVIVGFGTSAPELTVCIDAALAGQTSLALGNVVGSNLFNLFAVLGTTAMVRPVEVPGAILAVDIWVLTGVMGLFLAMLVTGWRLSRAEGAVLFALYLAYMAFLAQGG